MVHFQHLWFTILFQLSGHTFSAGCSSASSLVMNMSAGPTDSCHRNYNQDRALRLAKGHADRANPKVPATLCTAWVQTAGRQLRWRDEAGQSSGAWRCSKLCGDIWERCQLDSQPHLSSSIEKQPRPREQITDRCSHILSAANWANSSQRLDTGL